MFQKGHLAPVASRNNKDDRLSHMKTHSCHVFIITALFKKEKKTSSSHSVLPQDQMILLKITLLVWAVFPNSSSRKPTQISEF